MRISLGDVSLWFDVSGPSVVPQGDTTAERPVLVAVHGGPGLDHMTRRVGRGWRNRRSRSLDRSAGAAPVSRLRTSKG